MRSILLSLPIIFSLEHLLLYMSFPTLHKPFVTVCPKATTSCQSSALKCLSPFKRCTKKKKSFKNHLLNTVPPNTKGTRCSTFFLLWFWHFLKHWQSYAWWRECRYLYPFPWQLQAKDTGQSKATKTKLDHQFLLVILKVASVPGSIQPYCPKWHTARVLTVICQCGLTELLDFWHVWNVIIWLMEWQTETNWHLVVVLSHA